MNDRYNWKNFYPIGKRLLVHCTEENETQQHGAVKLVNLHAPKNHFELLRAAPDCEHPWVTNDAVLLRRLNAPKQKEFCINAKESIYCVPEKLAIGVFRGELLPLGRNVLLRRRISSVIDTNSKIIVPRFTQTQDQSLDAEVVALGLLPEGQVWASDDLKVNDVIKLKKWSQNIIELELHDGSFGLIVARSMISHIFDAKHQMLEYT